MRLESTYLKTLKEVISDMQAYKVVLSILDKCFLLERDYLIDFIFLSSIHNTIF